MEVAESDEALKVLGYSLASIKWRLRSPTKRRLEIDVLALCTGMRPVVMVDYGGKMPELQERLCSLLKLCQKESPIFEHLRVMVIEDMIYLIHARGFGDYIRLSLSPEAELVFVDLEQDPPKMITQAENSSIGMQLTSMQELFSLSFPLNGMKNDTLSHDRTDNMADAESSTSELIPSQSSEFIDFSSCMQDTQVTVPTLNGWLLGYPVVYLFGKELIADAIYNLSTKSLRIFKILVSRNGTPSKGSQQEEELMRLPMTIGSNGAICSSVNGAGFSVPYELSMEGNKEPWAVSFLAQMQSKWEMNKQVWRSLQMEVTECYPQAIVL